MNKLFLIFCVFFIHSCNAQKSPDGLIKFESITFDSPDLFHKQRELSKNDFTDGRESHEVFYEKKLVDGRWLLKAEIFIYAKCEYKYHGAISYRNGDIILGLKVDKNKNTDSYMCEKKFVYEILVDGDNYKLLLDIS